MVPPNIKSQDITAPAQEAASHPWFEKLARFGYAAKGIVYIIDLLIH